MNLRECVLLKQENGISNKMDFPIGPGERWERVKNWWGDSEQSDIYRRKW